MLVDRGGDVPRVLMGRRHGGHTFMPGKYVFPGGGLERSDGLMPSATELRPGIAAQLASRVVRRSEKRGRALALTAIRETYEETGILIGRRVVTDAPPARVAPLWRDFVRHGVAPDLAAVTFIGRAITPPRRPKRFDTRFFAVDRASVCGEADGFVGPDKEFVELAWVDLRSARALDLPRITAIMLDELEARCGERFGEDVPVPFYREEHGRFRRDLL